MGGDCLANGTGATTAAARVMAMMNLHDDALLHSVMRVRHSDC